jgi:hypothetical protein
MTTMLIPVSLLMAAFGPWQPQQSRAADPSVASAWQIGPIIRSRNYSVGMPLHPTQARNGWYIDFPSPHARAGSVHYVTFNPGSLEGKRRIVVRYRVEAARGVRFVSSQTPDQPATISLYLQRRGDTWSGRGRYASYRWYAPAQTVAQLMPGEHEMVVDLGQGWTSVQGQPASADPYGFQGAIANADQVGLVMGTLSARGHGVFATGPARLTVTSFQIL